MDITIRQVELFLSLVRNGQVKNVAREFHVTESAVSTAIKHFEEVMGVPLFDRAHKKISVNSNGVILADDLVGIVKQLQDAASMFKQDRVAGRLVLGASQTLADYLLPQVLYRFQMCHPLAKLSIWSSNSQEVVRAVERGDVALGFIEGEVQSRMVQPVFVASEELVVVTSDIALARERRYTIDELLQYRWILREPGSGTRSAFFRQLREKGKDLNVYLELPHTESIKHVLRNPGTLSCLSQHCVIHELARGYLYPVQIDGPRFTRNLYLVMHPRQQRTTLMEAVIENVTEALVKKGMPGPDYEMVSGNLE